MNDVRLYSCMVACMYDCMVVCMYDCMYSSIHGCRFMHERENILKLRSRITMKKKKKKKKKKLLRVDYMDD